MFWREKQKIGKCVSRHHFILPFYSTQDKISPKCFSLFSIKERPSPLFRINIFVAKVKAGKWVPRHHFNHFIKTLD